MTKKLTISAEELSKILNIFTLRTAEHTAFSDLLPTNKKGDIMLSQMTVIEGFCIVLGKHFNKIDPSFDIESFIKNTMQGLRASLLLEESEK